MGGKSSFVKIWMIVTCVLVACSLITTAGWAQDNLLEAARKEGKVVLYTTLPGKACKAVKAAFEEKYPGVKFEYYQAGSLDIIGRYEAERAAGKVKADLFHITDMVWPLRLKEQGNLLKYDCPEYPAYEYLGEPVAMPGYWAPFRILVTAPIVNTNIVGPKTIQSYEDMLKPEYKGMIASGDVSTSTRAYLNYYGLRKYYGTKWFEKLAQLDAEYYESSEKATSYCIAGRWPILWECWAYRYVQYGLKQGAPIMAVFPKEGVVMVPCPLGIFKQALHPNAAKLFLNFAYSKECQELLVDTLGVYSGRKDVASPEGLPKIDEIKILKIDYLKAADEREKLVKEWEKIVGR